MSSPKRRPRQIRVSESVERSLAEYARWEPRLHAFAWCDTERVRLKARQANRRDGAGELRGLPIGVKDIFDTAGIPTEYGSPIFSGRVPGRSALAVRRLEGAGAVVFGKTVTAELAYYTPGPTTNPWNAERTPGGSSMGSAAAVAAGVVPAALGTQTNGSLIRPAAFCGVVGFKPTHGRLPTSGVLRFSPPLDHVGVFAASVRVAARVAAVLAGEAPAAWLPSRRRALRPLLGVVRTPEWEQTESGMRERFDAVLAAASAAGATLRELELTAGFAAAIPVQRTIMAADASRFITPLVAHDRERVSLQLRDLLDEGAEIGASEYAHARRCQRALATEFDAWGARYDALVTPATLGEAPALATTGDPRCCTRWTLVGAPALSLPSGLSRDGLPLAVQLVGGPGRDSELLDVAAWLERVLPALGRPQEPPVTTP